MRSRALPLVVSHSTFLTVVAAGLFTAACGDDGAQSPGPVAPSGSTTNPTSSTAASSAGTPSQTSSASSSPSSTTASTSTPTGSSSADQSTTTGASGNTSSGGTATTGTSGGSGSSSSTTGNPSTSEAQSSAPATPVEWASASGVWSATIGATTFRVDEAGGRIVGYALNGAEILVADDLVSGDNANNFGSTFWLSPQADWNEGGWPPPTHIDSDDYEAEAADEVLTLTGPAGTDSASEPTNPISITKVFTPDAARNAITVDYQMKNGGTTAAQWAPWQITRVPSEGITFFPTGQAVAGLKAELPMTKVGSYSFWQYDEADIEDADGADHGDKFIGDGAGGWLAHVHDGTLLLLQFTDTAPPDFATDDGEIAIYASAVDPYIEIEPQGGVVSIPANGSSSWKVRWSLHALPTEVAAEPSEALGAFAQGLATDLGAL